MKNNLLLLLIICTGSCIEKIKFKREAYVTDKKVFYGFRSEVKKTPRFKLFKQGINQAFGLSPIEKSAFPYELRVHFIHGYGETFLLQQFDEKDSMNAKLYIADTDVINDSLIMKYKELVTTRGNYRYDGSFKIEGLETDSLLIKNHVPPNTLDYVSLFYFQIKIKNSVKYVIAEAIDVEQNKKNVERSIVRKIAQLEEDLGFNFGWERIIDSAFLNPYNLH